MADANSLVGEFQKDPGRAFLEVIEASPKPIRAQAIKQQIVDAGARKGDVDRHWTRVQRVIKLHPRVAVANNKYSWTDEPEPARSSLDVLAANLLAKIPSWLAEPLIQNVTDTLEIVSTGDTGHSDREFEKARLVADLAVAVEILKARGDSIDEVAKLFAEETQRKRLWPVGQPGETVQFDPETHEVPGAPPDLGAAVRVVRCGYIWRGGGEPVVAVKATVTV